MTSLRVVLAVATVILLAETSPGRLLYAQTAPSPPNAPVEPPSEAGMKVGIGPFQIDYGHQPDNRNVVGLEACLLCSRRAVFVEYSHWTKPRTSHPTGYKSADTVAAGLRLQGQARARPYFDAGVAIGKTRAAGEDLTMVGGVFGLGMTVGLTDRVYARVGWRLLVMSEDFEGTEVGVGAGWRF